MEDIPVRSSYLHICETQTESKTKTFSCSCSMGPQGRGHQHLPPDNSQQEKGYRQEVHRLRKQKPQDLSSGEEGMDKGNTEDWPLGRLWNQISQSQVCPLPEDGNPGNTEPRVEGAISGGISQPRPSKEKLSLQNPCPLQSPSSMQTSGNVFWKNSRVGTHSLLGRFDDMIEELKQLGWERPQSIPKDTSLRTKLQGGLPPYFVNCCHPWVHSEWPIAMTG